MKLRYCFPIVFLCFNTLIYAQKNWDSIRTLNETSFVLIDSNLDSAKKINNALFKSVNGSVPLDVHSSLWKTRAKIAFFEGRFTDAIESNLNLLKYAELDKDTLKILDALIINGIINYYRNAYKDAKRYLKKSISIVKNSSLPIQKIASPCNTLGALYNSLELPDSSILYYEKAINVLKNDTSSRNDEMKAIIYANIGAHYLAIGNLNEAINNLKLGITFNHKIGRKSGLAWCSNKLGSVYLKQNKLKKAYQLFQIADTLSGFSATLELQKDNKFSIIKYYLLKNKNDTALSLLSDYNILIDEIIADKTESSISEMQTKYETEKNEAALALSEEQKARLKAENNTNKLYLSIALISLLVLGLISFYTLRNSRQKRQISEMKLEIKDVEMKGLMANQESESFAAMLKGQEKERERIAQDLHDRLGGTLAALKHSLRRPENKVDAEDLNIIDEAVVEVRDIAHNLSSGLLEKQGLNVALEQLKSSIERSGKMLFNLYLHSTMAELGQEVALELFRIVQELTNNTLKHANATEISLQTSMNDQTFNLIYEDNGIGFDPEKVNGGIGLHNLKARVKKINGTLHIDSGEGRGTITIIELDLTA